MNSQQFRTAAHQIALFLMFCELACDREKMLFYRIVSQLRCNYELSYQIQILRVLVLPTAQPGYLRELRRTHPRRSSRTRRNMAIHISRYRTRHYARWIHHLENFESPTADTPTGTKVAVIKK
uniref:Secreted protein n=1 Tax=Daphnia galeata TaxID=27404 RepID=A0A8J2RQD2_9CRUS|nr:unnamed protein product [Daphnia galeata]